MRESGSAIQKLQTKWNKRRLFNYILFIISLALIISIINFVFATSLVVIVIELVAALVLLYLLKPATLSLQDITSYLNKTVPAYEESAHLLVAEHESFNRLEQIQVQKIQTVDTEHLPLPQKIRQQFRAALFFFCAAVIISVAVIFLPPELFNASNSKSTVNRSTFQKNTPLPPQIERAELIITPPGYLNQKQTIQKYLNLSVLNGSTVAWKLNTNRTVKNIELIVNNVSAGKFLSSDKKQWTKQMQFTHSGYYQLKIEEELSAIYTIEVIADQLPTITVIKPNEVTEIEPGVRGIVAVDATITDDHGLRAMTTTATIASGRGEAVKFKELQLSGNNFSNGIQRFNNRRQLDLAALGMKGGDEMYFYITATDSYNQEKKSDVYIIRIADTANLMSIEGMASGIDVKPEFFRSQRQIIIETQQLLLAKDTMSTALFQQRSNELGTDQKLLRLRYGKFLGEETDVDIGHDDDGHDEDKSGNPAAANQKTIDQYSHKHDNAEDANFFDAQTKKQLKAVLAEMWNAELKLRSIQPAAALPFEFKALTLLKELQQQTRVYVAKTGIKTAPLSNAKRLTGELDKISSSVKTIQYASGEDEPKAVAKALAVLQSLQPAKSIDASNLDILRQAAVVLGNYAISQPTVYASGFQSLRNILSGKFTLKDSNAAGRGLHQVAGKEKIVPSNYQTTQNSLSEQYFKRLKNNR